jgi:TonB-linked SusC/RagA family outer membrane protein
MNRLSFSTLRIGAVLLALLAGAGGGAWAQNAVIRGTVRSDVGELIVGGSVILPELAIQTATGANGQFLITVAAARVREQLASFRVRMIGFRPYTQTITIRPGEQVIDVALVTDINRLEDIVITGVMEGTPQTETTFSIGRLDVANLPVPANNPLSQLAGQVPGVSVMSASGRPGSSPDVLLRGPTSINGEGRGQQPLYIVDGVVLSGGLPSINAQDIENIEVVKGAAGASLYGARAANGVINITTKSGRTSAEGLTFRVRQEAGTSDVEHTYQNATQHALLMDATGTRFCVSDNTQPLCARTVDWIAERNKVNNYPGDYALLPVTFTFDPGSATPAAPLRQRFFSSYWPVPTYNAQRQVTTSNAFLSTNADATGRVGGTQYFASASYLDQKGAIWGYDGFKRYTARLNVDQRIGNNLSLAFRSYYARGIQDGVTQEGGTGSIFFALSRQTAPVNLLARDTLGRLMARSNIMNQGEQNNNPLIYTTENGNFDTQVDDRFIAGGTLRWTPISWADFEGNFSYDRAAYRYKLYRAKGFRTQSSARTNYLGYVRYNPYGNENYNASLNLTLRPNTGSDLATRFTFRYLYEQQGTYDYNEYGSQLSVVDVDAAINATTSVNIRSSLTSTRLIGLFAGVNFEYKQRYIADLLIRRDGSSLFGVDNRWATFGRVSLAYRLSQESWWPFRDALNEFKLRTSYGTAGGRPRWSAQYETYDIGAGGSLSPGQLGNRNLRPETNVENEFGADIEMFRRVGVTLTYSHSQTKDQILSAPLPAVGGFGSQWMNAGTMDNKTWELSVNLPIVHSRDLSWSMRFNYDRTRTMISKLGITEYYTGTPAQGTESMLKIAAGERYGTLYGYYVLRGYGDCLKLPTSFQGQCGPGLAFQTNSDGNLVWVGAGNTPADGLAKNLWMAKLPAAQAPWGAPLSWGMLITLRDSLGARRSVPLGNALPNYRFSVSQTFQYRRLSVYALLEAVMGRSVWNQGRHWSYMDLVNRDLDQRGVDPTLAKPLGYYYRIGMPDNGTGVGGMYQTLNPYNLLIEDASFAKLRELSVTYRVGRVGGFGNWDVSVIGRNLFTLTSYKGFDPEIGLGGGSTNSATINAVDAYNFPNTRTLTFALSTSF